MMLRFLPDLTMEQPQYLLTDVRSLDCCLQSKESAFSTPKFSRHIHIYYNILLRYFSFTVVFRYSIPYFGILYFDKKK